MYFLSIVDISWFVFLVFVSIKFMLILVFRDIRFVVLPFLSIIIISYMM